VRLVPLLVVAALELLDLLLPPVGDYDPLESVF
jgi:hypothetical protein